MAAARSEFSKICTWDEFSNKLVRHLRLPTGSRFALVRKGASGGGRPYIRSDVEIKRKGFIPSDLPREDDVKVVEICDRAFGLLAPGKWSKVVGFDPSNNRIDGRTLLKTWRAMGEPFGSATTAVPKKVTPSVIVKNEAIEFLTRLEGRGFSEQDIAEGFLRALQAETDPQVLEDAVADTQF